MKDNYLPPDWEEKTKTEKIFSIIGIVLAVLTAITIIISVTTKINLYYLYYSFIVLFLITQGIIYWKYNKPIAIIEFICSIIFLVAEIIMIIR